MAWHLSQNPPVHMHRHGYGHSYIQPSTAGREERRQEGDAMIHGNDIHSDTYWESRDRQKEIEREWERNCIDPSLTDGSLMMTKMMMKQMVKYPKSQGSMRGEEKEKKEKKSKI